MNLRFTVQYPVLVRVRVLYPTIAAAKVARSGTAAKKKAGGMGGNLFTGWVVVFVSVLGSIWLFFCPG